ncbi:O(6)-methylguanine-induced apoptosis 2 [Clydaea vesicula]|uniref:O(6)-methylguanine-induced apoptosis 2 n=1 Tax=Clydaea vesicula TaxID=447962 RepID=A0AAD5XY67_9FUNG|nr:O(6)-methylguanine-induced apoptosis 2 [Clydaea vesicula]
MSQKVTTSSDNIYQIKNLVKLSKEGGGYKEKKKLTTEPPSIPTAFQTFHYNESEKKAFLSTEARFHDTNVNDLPGPGYYRKKVDALPIEECSISKKGFGNGFASQEKRFQIRTNTVGPAHYNPTSTEKIKYYFHSTEKSSSFQRLIVPKSDIRLKNIAPYGIGLDLITSTQTPAPGKYEVDNKNNQEKFKSQTESSVFKSKSSKAVINYVNNPSPAQYEVKKLNNSLYGVSSFKAIARSEQKIDTTPSPASYNVLNTKVKRSTRRRGPFLTVAQHIKPADRPPTTKLCNDPRSRPQSSKFNDLHSSYVQHKLGPGPGRYNIAKASDTLKMHRNVFIDETERFQKHKPNIIAPGYYQPIKDVKFRSFHLNMEKIWC